MSNVPRDPSTYWPTEHAVIRKKMRGISWDAVSDAIANGRLHNEGNNNTCVFIHPTEQGLLYVTANHENGAIATVAWYE